MVSSHVLGMLFIIPAAGLLRIVSGLAAKVSSGEVMIAADAIWFAQVVPFSHLSKIIGV